MDTEITIVRSPGKLVVGVRDERGTNRTVHVERINSEPVTTEGPVDVKVVELKCMSC